MARVIDLDKSVYDLVKEYPNVKDVMYQCGFKDIVKPMALSTVGRVMTIPKGAAIKEIDMETVLRTFRKNGFTIKGEEAAEEAFSSEEASLDDVSTETSVDSSTPEGRAELLKSYISRLSSGEDLEKVRSEFVANFENVDAAEIAGAEQNLIKEGAKIEDVQRLCDVHSALFHGATRDEQIMNAEAAVIDSLNRRKSTNLSESGSPDSLSHFSKYSEEITVNTADEEVGFLDSLNRRKSTKDTENSKNGKLTKNTKHAESGSTDSSSPNSKSSKKAKKSKRKNGKSAGKTSSIFAGFADLAGLTGLTGNRKEQDITGESAIIDYTIHTDTPDEKINDEKIAHEESAILDSVNSNKSSEKNTAYYARIVGHPINVMMSENVIINELIKDVAATLSSDADTETVLHSVNPLHQISCHYAKKGDLIYPLLNRKYGYSGPSDVMWGVDDEIRDEIRLLITTGSEMSDFEHRLSKVITRAEEMIYKENNILYPLCAQMFSEEDWMRIYYEIPAYETLIPDGYPTWMAAEQLRKELRTVGGKVLGNQGTAAAYNPLYGSSDPAHNMYPHNDGMITLGSGHMTQEQILGVLNTIPMELTFVDEENINRFFNAGYKLFKRPDMAIDRDVFSCHPPRIQQIVGTIIDSFKQGTENSVDIWMTKGDEPVLVRYMAVRNEDGEYIGTLECVQEMGFAKKHFQEENE